MFKKSKEELELEKIQQRIIELHDDDFKEIAKITAIPNELIMSGYLTKSEFNDVMAAVRAYSEKIKFLYVRQKQAKSFFADKRRE